MGSFPGGQGGDGKSGQEMLLGFCIGLIVGGSVGAVIMAAVQIAARADKAAADREGAVLLKFGDDDDQPDRRLRHDHGAVSADLLIGWLRRQR